MLQNFVYLCDSRLEHEGRQVHGIILFEDPIRQVLREITTTGIFTSLRAIECAFRATKGSASGLEEILNELKSASGHTAASTSTIDERVITMMRSAGQYNKTSHEKWKRSVFDCLLLCVHPWCIDSNMILTPNYNRLNSYARYTQVTRLRIACF